MAKVLNNNQANSSIRILIIDQSDSRAAALEAVLRKAGHIHIFHRQPSRDLVEQVAEYQPDVVLVEIDDPQRDILEQLATLRDRLPTPVAVFCQDSAAQSIRSAVESGVCAYVVEGVHPEQVQPAIGLAMATFSAYARLRNEAVLAKAELEDRKKVDRAKRFLMSSQNLTEEQAYQAIKKLAMNRQRKLAEAADDLIEVAKLFDGKS